MKKLSSIRYFIVLVWCVFGLVFPTHAASQLNTDLVYEAAIGTGARIQALLDQGAYANATDDSSVHALSLAASRVDAQALPAVKALVEAGANLEVVDQYSETPLMNAIAVQNLDVVHYLVQKGADIYAVTPAGKTVISQAEWSGNDEIITLIKSMITEDADQARESVSERRHNKLMDDYLYTNCAYQYQVFYKESEQDPLDEEIYKQTVDQMLATINNALIELQHYFNYKESHLLQMAETTQQLIFDQMEGMISNRNRRANGIGAEGDMEKRCNAILEDWHTSFKEAADGA